MSKEFLLDPKETISYNANKYSKITKYSDYYKYFDSKGNCHWFGYCTCCNLKVFLSKPKTKNGDWFFRHVKGYYTGIEQIKMLSCDNYHPSKGNKGDPEPLPTIYIDEIITFLKDNAYWCYKFINSSILRDLGTMSLDFFISTIKDIFITNVKELTTADRLVERTLPYNILSLINRVGTMPFSEIRYSTINFDTVLIRESITYFNSILFSYSYEEEHSKSLRFEIIKSKSYGSDLLRPKTLYSKMISINTNDFYLFIKKHKRFEDLYSLSNDEIKKRYPKNEAIIIKEKNKFIKVKTQINAIF